MVEKEAHRMCLRTLGAVLLMLLATSAQAQMQKIGEPPEAENMRLVGYNDLQGRSAYQPTIHHQKDRWIAYIGHHGGTDADPQELAHDQRIESVMGAAPGRAEHAYKTDSRQTQREGENGPIEVINDAPIECHFLSRNH